MCPSTCVPNVDAQHQIRWLSNSKNKYYIRLYTPNRLHGSILFHRFHKMVKRYRSSTLQLLCDRGRPAMARRVNHGQRRVSTQLQVVHGELVWVGCSWLQLLRNITTFLEDKIANGFFRWIFLCCFLRWDFWGFVFFFCGNMFQISPDFGANGKFQVTSETPSVVSPRS